MISGIIINYIKRIVIWIIYMNEKVIETSLSVGGILTGYMLANRFFELRSNTLLFINRIDIFLNCAVFIS
jgi:hypothetical protein